MNIISYNTIITGSSTFGSHSVLQLPKPWCPGSGFPLKAENSGILKGFFLLYLQFWFCIFKPLTSVSSSICIGLRETTIFNFDSQILVPLFCCWFFFLLVWWISEVSGQKNRCTCKHCCELCSLCILNWYLTQNKLKTAEREQVMLTKSHIKYITNDAKKNAFLSSELCAAKLEATSWSGYFTAIYWKK